jgi:hypothetical protein
MNNELPALFGINYSAFQAALNWKTYSVTKGANMNKAIKSVWIESEELGAIIEGSLPNDDNSDVIVTFNDNTRYIASFFTYTNINRLRRKNEQTVSV